VGGLGGLWFFGFFLLSEAALGIPDYIDPEAWYGFVDMRKRMGKSAPWTELAEKLALRNLEEFYRQGYDVNAILEYTILGGYRGLFVNHNTPRRQLNQQDKANQAKVMALVAKVGK
jgi:hypothetical protein